MLLLTGHLERLLVVLLDGAVLGRGAQELDAGRVSCRTGIANNVHVKGELLLGVGHVG